ncbi:MAG: amidohydrolase [Eubacteriales bacterium]|nr:amidohydrolase [Eubacteriales bacterium]
MDYERISSLARSVYPQMLTWRHHFHQNPEISFEEWETTDFICQQLDSFGVAYQRNENLPGLIATLPGRADGPILAFRADIDALAMTEENDLPFRSCRDNVMHACGHDVHTATLLGLAKVLAANPDLLPGTVKLIFQPAEELSPGGAKPMLDSGRLDDVQRFYGFHVRSTQELGQVGIKSGPLMAAADRFYITFQGHGGHGGRPYQTIDPILMASQAVVAIQGIVARMVDPQEPAVISICQINGGTAFNIIPDDVRISGTVRTFHPAVQELIMTQMEQVVKGVCDAYGGTYVYEYHKGYPVLNNHPEETQLLEEAFSGLYDYQVYTMPMTTGGEDFSYFLQKAGGSFFNVGGLTPGTQAQPHHNPKFMLDERCMEVGLSCFLSILGKECDRL